MNMQRESNTPKTDVAGTWPAPTTEELQDFMNTIPPTLFGPEYVILAHRWEFVFCEIRL